MRSEFLLVSLSYDQLSAILLIAAINAVLFAIASVSKLYAKGVAASKLFNVASMQYQVGRVKVFLL